MANRDRISRSAAFTLIELLVVISIIGMLASIILVSLQGAKNKARIASGLQFESSIYQALGGDIVADFTFDNANNPGQDYSGRNNNASWTGSAATSVAGLKNKALDFSFGGGLSASSLNLAQYTGFTISAFIYPRAFTGASDGSGCSHWVYDPTFYGIACQNTIWINNTSSRQYATSPDFKLNDWNHVVLSYRAGNMDWYIDGKFINTQYIGNLNNSASTLYIGGPGIPWNSNGLIDDVRVYGKEIPR